MLKERVLDRSSPFMKDQSARLFQVVPESSLTEDEVALIKAKHEIPQPQLEDRPSVERATSPLTLRARTPRKTRKGSWTKLLQDIKKHPVWKELLPREQEFLATGVLHHGPTIFVSVDNWIMEVREDRVRLAIERKRGVSRATAFRALGGLVKKRVLVWEQRNTRDGWKTTSKYTLNQEMLFSETKTNELDEIGETA